MINTKYQLAWLAVSLLLPLSSFSHDGEVLLAKLTLHTSGNCTLKVTADLDANFVIRDRSEFIQATQSLFLISSDKETVPLSNVVETTLFTSATKHDVGSPIPHAPEELANPCRLENVEWHWSPNPHKFILRLPEMSPHTVLLWLVDEGKPNPKPRWVMMVANDESPLIQTPQPNETEQDFSKHFKIYFYLILCALFLWALWRWWVNKLSC